MFVEALSSGMGAGELETEPERKEGVGFVGSSSPLQRAQLFCCGRDKEPLRDAEQRRRCD